MRDGKQNARILYQLEDKNQNDSAYMYRYTYTLPFKINTTVCHILQACSNTGIHSALCSLMNVTPTVNSLMGLLSSSAIHERII